MGTSRRDLARIVVAIACARGSMGTAGNFASRYVAADGGKDAAGCGVRAPSDPPNGRFPCASVQYAVNLSHAGDQVILLPGTHLCAAAPREGVRVSATNVTIRGDHANATATVLDCRGDRRAFQFDGAGLGARLYNFSVANGYALAGGAANITGGSSPQFRNMRWVNNTAEYGGGAVVVSGVGTAPAFSDCVFEDNSVLKGGGGATWVKDKARASFRETRWSGNQALGDAATAACSGGGSHISGSGTQATFSSCTFAGNNASGVVGTGVGGGISVTKGATVVFNDTSFVSNYALAGGGGLYIDTCAKCRFEGGSFVHNRVPEHVENTNVFNLGGGARIGQSDIAFNKVTWHLNDAPDGGGGVSLVDGACPHFNNCTFSNNTALSTSTIFGGGGALMHGSACPTFVGTQWRGNVARVRGGGAYIRDPGTNPIFHRVTFEDNAAIGGDGARVGGGVAISVSAKPHFKESLWLHNHAGRQGGAIFVAQAQTGAQFETCEFVENQVDKNSDNTGNGGGVQITIGAGTEGATCVLIFTQCIFTRNACEGGTGCTGGGVSITIAAVAKFFGCVWRQNSAVGQGGGVAFINNKQIKSAFEDCLFEENIGGSAGCMTTGGGLYLLSSGATFTRTSFVGNTAPAGGGAAEIMAQPTMEAAASVFEGCNFVNNSAPRNGANGGAVNLDGGTRGCTRARFRASRFSGNEAFKDGGAVYSMCSRPIFEGCNFTNNRQVVQGGMGGGAFLQDTLNQPCDCPGSLHTVFNKTRWTSNHAAGSAGAVAMQDSSPVFNYNTFDGNTAILRA